MGELILYKPIEKNYNLLKIPLQGRFEGIRKFDIHTGIDLYCDDREPVYAIEEGIIVNITLFTGGTDSSWWYETYAILVEGKSGVILYGELYKPTLIIGDKVLGGKTLGFVKRVLKKDKGFPTTMLHLELYKKGYRGEGEWWRDCKPKELENIEKVLSKIY
jgi:murein DD-endopeptidase MepM/ murein hydrolase activator NlpD